MPASWKGQYSRYKDIFFNLMATYKKRPDLKMFLEIFLTLTTASFFTLFALRPTLITISTLITENRSREETLAQLTTKVKNLAAAKSNYAQESLRIPQVLASVPDSPKPETFVRQIEGLAIASNVEISSLTLTGVTLAQKKAPITSDKSSSKDVKMLSFIINAKGSYPSLLKFLSDIENLRRPVQIDTSGVNSTKGVGGSAINLAINGKVPYLGIIE